MCPDGSSSTDTVGERWKGLVNVRGNKGTNNGLAGSSSRRRLYSSQSDAALGGVISQETNRVPGAMDAAAAAARRATDEGTDGSVPCQKRPRPRPSVCRAARSVSGRQNKDTYW